MRAIAKSCFSTNISNSYIQPNRSLIYLIICISRNSIRYFYKDIIYKDSFNNPVPTANDTWLFRRHFAEYVIGTISFIYFNFQKFNIHCIVRSIICFPISLLLTFVYFLGRSDFITGDTPTVADLLAASELEQPSIPIPL